MKLSYQSPSGSATAHSATTAQDGTFSDRLNAAAGSLLTSGMWTIQAQYSGDSAHASVRTHVRCDGLAGTTRYAPGTVRHRSGYQPMADG